MALTTDVGAITCQSCRRDVADKDVDHDELAARAWLACCRARGAPSPQPHRTEELVAMQAANRLQAVLDELSDPWTVLVESLLVRQAALGDVFRECLIRWIERLSQASREGLRPVLDEYLMASDLLDEIDRAFERAARATSPATVPTNSVVVVAGIVSDESPRARSARSARAVLRAIARRPDPLIDSDDAEVGVVS